MQYIGFVLQVFPQVFPQVQPELPEERRQPAGYAPFPGRYHSLATGNTSSHG